MVLNKDQITTHLNLYAVMHVLNELSGHKAGIKKTSLSVGFLIPDVSSDPITLKNILEGPTQIQKPRVILAFRDAACFNQFMDGKGLSFSINKGWYRIDVLVRFLIIMLRLQQLLRPSQRRLSNPSLKRRHTQSLLILGLQAAKELAVLESKSQWVLQNGPQGVVEFRISGTDIYTWCAVLGTRLEYGIGHPPERANVIITFTDIDKALTSYRNEVDFLSTTGMSWIKVRGFIPLADTLGFVMDRVHVYLKP